MHDIYKWVISVIGGAIAAFLGQYGIIVALVATSVIFDVVTGLIRAKATGEGLSSEKAHKGFWRKMSLFAAFFFGIFLDYAATCVILKIGANLGYDMPFAMIIAAYIIINEAISISENLYLTNPDSFPPQIGKWLKVAKKEIEQKGSKGDGRTEKGDGRTEQQNHD